MEDGDGELDVVKGQRSGEWIPAVQRGSERSREVDELQYLPGACTDSPSCELLIADNLGEVTPRLARRLSGSLFLSTRSAIGDRRGAQTSLLMPDGPHIWEWSKSPLHLVPASGSPAVCPVTPSKAPHSSKPRGTTDPSLVYQCMPCLKRWPGEQRETTTSNRMAIFRHHAVIGALHLLPDDNSRRSNNPLRSEMYY
jgi:hypothetical protein